jgi:hypothetical protein
MILVSVDSQALPYLNRLQLINKNEGGVPGAAPRDSRRSGRANLVRGCLLMESSLRRI